jgi:hypothetical protein
MMEKTEISRRTFIGSSTLAATVGLAGVGLGTTEVSADIISKNEAGTNL